MRKQISVLAIISVIILSSFSLMSCEGKTSGKKEAADFGGRTVKIWSQGQLDPRKDEGAKSSPTYAEEVAKWNKLEADFNCTLEVVTQNNYDHFRDEYVTAFSANTVIADIVTGDITMSYPTWMISGMLEPINDYFDIEDKNGDSLFEPEVSKAHMYQGKCYAVSPKNNMLPKYIMLFNKTLFETNEKLKKYDLFQLVKDKQWTWDKMREIAKEATIDKNGDGKPDIMGLASRGQPGSFLTNALVISNGCNFIIQEKEKATFDLDSPAGLEALSFSYKLAWEDYSLGVTGVFDSWTGGEDEFKAGRVAMIAAGTYDIIWKDVMDDEVGVLPIPIGPRSDDYISDQQTSDFWGLVPGAPDPGKCAKLIMAIFTPAPDQPKRTNREAYERYVDNQESLDMIELMLTKRKFNTYYSYKIMIDQFLWSDYGLREKIPAATFVSERKAATQAALDAIWQPLSK